MSENKPPPRPPTVPVRMGLGAVHRAASQDPVETTRLPPGGGLETLAAVLDVRALTLGAFDGSTGILDVLDRKNNLLRLQHSRGVDCTVARVVGRERPAPVPLTDTMGRELVPALASCVERALVEPRWSDQADALRTWLRALADAAEVPLGGVAFLASSQEFQKGREKVAFSQQHAWKGFSKQPAMTGPPMKPTTARDIRSTGRLEAVAPGMDRTTTSIGAANGKSGFLLFADADGRELSLQQTKFSLPPQFSVEYAAPGAEPIRNPVDAPLARELAELISALIGADAVGPHEQAVAQMGKALLKVL